MNLRKQRTLSDTHMIFDALIVVPEITKGMKSIGSKALLKIKNSIAILDYQILQLNSIPGIRDIYVCIGFESEKIKKTLTHYSNVKTIYNDEYLTTNQSKSVALYLENVDKLSNLLVINNGVLFKDCFKRFLGHNSILYVIDKPKIHFNIGCNHTESVEYLFYDFPIPWAECVMFNTAALNMLRSHVSKSSIDQNYLFETINLLLSNKIVFDKVTIPKNKVMKVSSVKDIQKAKLFI